MDYDQLSAQLRALLTDEPDPLASTANFVALLNDAMSDVNWLGVYVLRDDELVLGPFQGSPACVRIAVGRGVCGVAAATQKTQRIADVQQFADHIVCDVRSRSELVVPLLIDDTLIGVLDIDSPSLDRFSQDDQTGIEKLCATFCDLQRQRSEFI